MAGKDRNSDAHLAFFQQLCQEPYRYGFNALLREFECMYNDMPRIGYSSRPNDDPLRLGQMPSMQFAPSTLASATVNDAAILRLKVLFFGLFGPNGPLPLHLTEYAINRVRGAKKDTTLADFADLFHHRLLSLFYRAWADKEPTVQFDRPEKDHFRLYMGALAGIGLPSLQNRDAMPDPTKLHFTAHLACHTKHGEGLAAILGDFFKVPMTVMDFIGEWLAIPKNNYCYLNDDPCTGQLGNSAIIGKRTWQCQHKFRVRVGPLNLATYEAFLPTGISLKKMRDVIYNYLGMELNWDVNLLLKKQEVPTARLGHYGQLGWTTWLHAKTRPEDASDLYLVREKI